jgi:hypothetical protein
MLQNFSPKSTHIMIKLGNYKRTKQILIKKLTKYVFSQEYKTWLNSFINLRFYSEDRIFHYHKMININGAPYNIENENDYPNYEHIDKISNKVLATLLFFKNDNCKMKMKMLNDYLVRAM